MIMSLYKERETSLTQAIKALPPVVREYISISNQLMVPKILVSEQNELRSRRAQIIQEMTITEKRELMKFGDFVHEKLRTNQPIGEALNYGVRK